MSSVTIHKKTQGMNYKSMLKKVVSRKKEQTVELLPFLIQLEKLRLESGVLVLVPGTTAYSWMGVNRATTALFPSNTLVLPHYYSNSLFSENDLKQFVLKIIDLQFVQVIFSGFPLYFEQIMIQLKKENIQTGLIYHGFFSELAGNEQQANQLNKIIELSKHKILDKIAFNKKGMGESLQFLHGIDAHKIILKTPNLGAVAKNDSEIRIGVLGNDQFRKNLHNQLVAASMLEKAQIHVTTNSPFSYLPQAKIIRHQTGQNHSDFTQLLGSMHVNLHLSYSESWGQLTTESLAMGVPCLTSYHSDVFDYNEDLKQKLVVADFDNSWAIKEKIESVLADSSLPNLCKSYIQELNRLSDQSIEHFLNA